MNQPTRLAVSVANNRLVSTVAFAAVAAAIAVVAVQAHAAAGLTLPLPSGDEAFFVWQGRAFAQSNSFIAPEVDPSRPILLLPFVYSALIGLVFKVTGASLQIARYVSLGCLLAGFAMCALMVRRLASPVLSLVVVGAFFLNSRFVVMANSVRMEALLLAVLCLALLLSSRNRDWLALAVLSLAPMIHPNAVLYIVPFVAYGSLIRKSLRSAPERAAIAVFIVAGLVWLAHGIYVLRFWDGFVHDTAHRLGEAATGTAKTGMAKLAGWQLLDLGLIAIVGAMSWRRGAKVGYLLAFAVGAWSHSHLRIEEPYAPFADLVYLLIALASMEVAATFVRTESSMSGMLRPAVSGVVGVVALFAFLRLNKIDGPFNYFSELSIPGMRVTAPGTYFRSEDRLALQTVLKRVNPQRPITVEVYPWSDALLIGDLSDERVHFQLPYFDPMFRPASQWIWGYGPTPGLLPDLYIVRVSRYTPKHLRYRPDSMFAQALRHPEVDPPEILYSRDSTEVWYGMRVRRTPGGN